MKRKLFKSLFAIACLLSSTNMFAYDFEVDGIYYEVISFSDLTCMVTKGGVEYSGDIVIPATIDYNNRTLTIVEIADQTFRNCNELTSITIPNTISSIGSYMFNGCSGLAHVNIEDGENVLNLGYNYYSGSLNCKGLFYDCPLTTVYIGRNLSYETNHSRLSPFACNTSLKVVTIGDAVTSISYAAFYECSELTSITIGKSVTQVEENAFLECTNLTSVHIPDLTTWCMIKYANIFSCPFVFSSEGHLLFNGEEIKKFVIPNSITSTNPYAFYKCTGLEKITIPSSITTIGKTAFSGCIGLENIIIPSSVEDINYEVFNGCTNLTEVIIEDGETELSLDSNFGSGRTDWLGKGLFYDCPITTLYIGRNLSYSDEMHKGYSPFYGIKTIKEVTLGNHVSKIENYLFGLCSGLESVTIPSSVTSIGNNVFQDCTSLTNLTIPYSVISIGNSVFSGCTGLTTLYSLNNIPPSIGTDNFSNNHYMTLNVYVPQKALTAYQNAEIWKDFWNLQGIDNDGNEDNDGTNGIIISNEKTTKQQKRYDAIGREINNLQKGLNIIKMSDGTTKKVIMR